MAIRLCSNCGLRNSGGAWNCYFCGNTLSVKSVVEVEDDVGAVILLIDKFIQENSTENKLKQLDELSKCGTDIVEIPRFFRLVSERDLTSEVRKLAKEKLSQMELGESLTWSLKNKNNPV